MSRAGGTAAALVAGLVLCAGAASARAATLHVDDDAAAGGNGSAQAPYKSIQSAIGAAAQSGDEIRVARGSYGPVVVSGKQVTLLGGYAGAGDFGARNPGANQTIIRGDATGPALRLFNARQSVVDGFVITGGQRGVEIDSDDFDGSDPMRCAPLLQGNLIEGNGTPSIEGGGVAANRCRARIVKNVIRGNVADRGAGLAAECDGLLVEGNRIENNTGHGDHGGGIVLYGAGLVVRGNLFRNNRIGEIIGYGWGGGALVDDVGTSATFEGNVWTGNKAVSVGSALFFDNGATGVVEHDLFYDNDCAEQGGHGVYVDGDDQGTGTMVTLENVTIAHHDCPGTQGGAVVIERFSTVTVKSSILWQNGGDEIAADGSSSFSVSYSDSDEAFGGAGNIGGDPLFADPAAGDFHVRSSKGRFDPASGNFVTDAVDSPTIDSGDPAGDFALEPGPNGLRVNMGHTGGTAEASMGAPGGMPPADAGPRADGGAFDDAGPLPDGGGPGGDDDDDGGGGCGCRTVGASGGAGAGSLLGAVLLLSLVRRSRRTLRR